MKLLALSTALVVLLASTEAKKCKKKCSGDYKLDKKKCKCVCKLDDDDCDANW